MILCFIHYFLLLQLSRIYEMMATSSRLSCVGNYNILKNWHTWKKNTTNLIPMPNRFNGICFSSISTPKHCMVNTIMIRTSHTRNFILFKTQSLMEWWLINTPLWQVFSYLLSNISCFIDAIVLLDYRPMRSTSKVLKHYNGVLYCSFCFLYIDMFNLCCPT